jgi:tellurite resistance protein
MIGHHSALIYTMVLTAASDRDINDPESRRITQIVRNLPVFADFDRERLPQTVDACIDLLQDEEGLDRTFGLIKESLPKRLRETAYALACDVAASNGTASQEVLRMLEMLRHRLEIDRLIAAGIERGARARFTVLKPKSEEEST